MSHVGRTESDSIYLARMHLPLGDPLQIVDPADRPSPIEGTQEQEPGLDAPQAITGAPLGRGIRSQIQQDRHRQGDHHGRLHHHSGRQGGADRGNPEVLSRSTVAVRPGSPRGHHPGPHRDPEHRTRCSPLPRPRWWTCEGYKLVSAGLGQPAVKKAGLGDVQPPIGFHDLRRLAATNLVLANVDHKTTMNRMGHSDIRLTFQVYAAATTPADRAAANASGDRIFGTTVAHESHADSLVNQ
jgi:hypothetical protein